MIVDSLVEPETIRQPITGRKIDARRPFGIRRCVHRPQTRIHITRSCSALPNPTSRSTPCLPTKLR